MTVKKDNLREQLIVLMEIPFYIMYFLESTSSIQSQQKNVLSQQNNFGETVKWIYNLVHHNLSRERRSPARLDQS